MEKKLMTIRAWKDAEYRATLTPEQLALIEPNPWAPPSPKKSLPRMLVACGLATAGLPPLAANATVAPAATHSAQTFLSNCRKLTSQ
ncbi:mersacidin/lichenicidin family type 2 lantibiotic [Hymenobacter cellulosilyticus]|uniref:Mersacidin/lichenicidin family type 2 lantibiotic n=1 Tax=Hymenobacter cellulosilyticus TaxID=2932248 RepID=A0A8T9Q8A0_9BACT|nr:mersacidin/lichenicidin family type 2 lantibiotic [Hymenobacter cellulosilyticus]UOQ73172.1 mersacidin/lichenicidin family type 2 lantibiotic [Hymenobacter cellulosilyticus]